MTSHFSRAIFVGLLVSVASSVQAQTSPDDQLVPVIRLSPSMRSSPLSSNNIPVISASAIEPFLAEALIVDKDEIDKTPRIVATQEGRVLLSRGDRAYARGTYTDGDSTGNPLSDANGQPQDFRVFRNATPLLDPNDGRILGYEIQYIGKAALVRGESSREVTDMPGQTITEVTPATIDIVAAKEEIRVGDRLVPEPPRELLSFSPHAPSQQIKGQVVSTYGSTVTYASANQIVVLNRGLRDGLERGHILAIMKNNTYTKDLTDPAKSQLALPPERNGLLMVFRSFANLSYALILEINDGVKIGDHFSNP